MDGLSTRDVPKVDFNPRRLGHVNLYVGDLNSSTDFYTNVAGIELVRREPGIDAVFVSNGNTHHDVALMQCKGVRCGRDVAATFRRRVSGVRYLVSITLRGKCIVKRSWSIN